MIPSIDHLSSLLDDAPPGDDDMARAVRARADDILRPAGALARLDELAVWVARWQATDQPDVASPEAIVFAADHGVTAEGVSAYPAEVTAAMLGAFESGQASISVLAAVAGATVRAVDVGVGRPTGNLRVEAALDRNRFAEAWTAGQAAVAESSADMLVFGEMGIGNTTAAAAVTAAILGVSAEKTVGRGTGIDDGTRAHKVQVVEDALDRIVTVRDPLAVLAEVGGAELVAIAGATVEARRRRIPVLLDGYIATAPILALDAADHRAVEHVMAGHRSAEPGHRLALERLGLEPLLDLDLRLGEASGAMAAIPLVRSACRLVTAVPTFAEFFGPPTDD